MSEYNKTFTKIFISGKLSSTLVIPIKTARKYGFDKPCPVLVAEMNGGIFIKKLDVDKL